MDKVVIETLQEIGLKCQSIPKENSVYNIFHLDLNVSDTSIEGVIGLEYDTYETIINFKLPSFAQEETKQKMSEMFNRINYEMSMGKFFMEFDSDAIGFITCFYFDGLNENQFKHFLKTHISYACGCTDLYFKSILECRFSDKSPTEILNALEQSINPDSN